MARFSIFRGATKSLVIHMIDQSISTVDGDVDLDLSLLAEATLYVDPAVMVASPVMEFEMLIETSPGTDGKLVHDFIETDTNEEETGKYFAQVVMSFSDNRTYKTPIFEFYIEENVFADETP